MRFVLIAMAITALSPRVIAQAQSQPAKPSPGAAAPPAVLTTTLSLEDPVPVLGAPPVPILSLPVACTSNGMPVITGYASADSDTSAIFRITTDHEAVVYRTSQITGLSNIFVQDIYAGNDPLVMLIAATPATIGKSFADRPAEPKFYLARFEDSGQLIDNTQLDLPFTPFRIARFPSGEYLAEGTRAQDIVLAFLRPDGSFNSYIDLYDDLRIDPKALEKSFGPGQGSVPRAAMRMYFAPSGNNILLISKGTTLPVLVLSHGGIVRSVPVAHSAEKVLDYFVTATPTVWTMRFSRSSSNGTVSEDITMDDISADDGHLIRHYATAPLFPSDIACGNAGEFNAIKFDDKLKALTLIRSR